MNKGFGTLLSRRHLASIFLPLCLAACVSSPEQQASVDLTPGQKPQGAIHTKGTEILASNGKPLVLRGVNLQYGDNPGARLAMIDEIASTGANAIRLQLRKDTTRGQLREALDAIVAKKMVAVVMYWEDDVTCQKHPAGFSIAMMRWTNLWKSVLSDPKYRPYLIINIVNEWGEADELASYIKTYQGAIKSLRSAGYPFPLMIDAAHCGQDYKIFANGTMKAIAEADPLSNIIFSTHAYWSYQKPAAIDAAVSLVQDAGYPFVWGEFGQSAFQTAIGQNTDHRWLISSANDKKIGYLAWSWYGNGGDAKVLDMSTNGKASNLSPYGKELLEGMDMNGKRVKGIRETSVLAGE